MDRIYNKLVRDKIPDIIKSNGETPIVKTLNMQDYKRELEKKLEEECREVIEASGSERVEELADVLEILKALAVLENSNLDEIITVADKKNSKRGAFEKRIFLERVVPNQG